ncbi:MAG: ferrous iron transport protein A [Betaproteobacteria bacterium]|jgi:ferrous iron transport protein A|uniref:Ferrous iron transport protein A (Modular protein) n=1 Tax=Thiomonas delicata TaxID=364030 RepID=A0A238D5T7_THIDL|nr:MULTISPECIES: FeoA family protein [Thiomonas]MDE2128086.1 ferrous iron transport protein A [Betaproteobacteria bacterium]OZB44444.1 MAG: ferrous iron transport protein A [Thiomonas sp. 15-66-11]OZB54624.1 MAG: ferrous iron transport protein A [Thiomonas sp. 14-66-4]OZB65865.1 MAG: ferrous iron transport protein A [Thiomonas sp. 13-66-29]SBP88677.1 Ferrous iron transport protein A (Modular protein) [Thiomonas delicata]
MNTLASLHPGTHAIVTQVRAEGALQHRLAALGLRAGNELEVLRQARFRGPIHVRIGTTELFLRRADARQVEIAQVHAHQA